MNELSKMILDEVKSRKGYGTKFSVMDEFYNSENEDYLQR